MKRSFIILMVLILSFFSACKKENQLPTCAITYPENGDEFEKGDTIAISVEANDNDGSIVEINYNIDDIKVFSSNSFPYGYSWNTLDETIGDHIIKVTAKDNEGGSKTDECTITIIENATVVTTEASSITHNSAISGGNISNDGGSVVTARGVCWSISTNPTISDEHTTDDSGTGIYASSITELLPVTTYYVKAYATNGAGTTYGNEISFTTLFESGTLIDTRDGYTYRTVRIGNQWWMAENLKVTNYPDGTVIQLVEDNSAWEALGYTDKAYCYYDNDSTNGDTYGALYTWSAAMNGTASSVNNPSGVQGVCPDGWHVPSDSEWTQLLDYLGDKSVAGGKLKETGTTHWNSPNTGATNISGFTALPGGKRQYSGTFILIGNNSYWWSSTKSYTPLAWYWLMYYDNSSLNSNFTGYNYGFSVRCVKDE